MRNHGHRAEHQPGWSLDRRDPRFIEAFQPFWAWLYEHYFRVQTEGWEQIPEGQVMLVGSHNGGLGAPDMFMMVYDWVRRFGTDRLVYGLMHSKVWQACPPAALMAERAGAIAAHPKMALAALDRGASLLVYPGGAQDVFRPFYQRDQIQLGDRKGFVKIAIQRQIPIVPVVSWGAHETLLVLADIYPLMERLHELGMPWLLGIDPEVFPIYLGLPWGIAFGPLPNIPWPRPIATHVGTSIYFEHYGAAAARDRAYVDACYWQVHLKMQHDLNHLIARHGDVSQ
ncbi:lysophospholipid acyltransferase family protein [Leptolyngbya sp. CCNP1308]|uniref:lysophospholipid acyltransferase family protein n=1 Tax=Leptolyngbya sp. CCNP1308 TaxID=3110255 RepID=UPI002B218449|nr:lysophospholipid acyltransferase family protein [Leptolyngbya sp. CCNP1308]MEA5450962.1 lysophospholipid acyltransferase family protein [Leptolyngbya sp. CCNP1308]